jgi:hypothetical protein
MDTTVTLDERHYKAALAKARELGKTPGGYIESLIDAATSSFDEILAPVREGFSRSGVSEEELDEAVAKARKEIHGASGSGTP